MKPKISNKDEILGQLRDLIPHYDDVIVEIWQGITPLDNTALSTANSKISLIKKYKKEIISQIAAIQTDFDGEDK